MAHRTVAAAETPPDGTRTRVAVVAAVRLYRDGIAEVLAREGFAVAGVAASAAEALALAADVVLVDLAFGAELVEALQAAEPDARVVVLGIGDGDVVAWAEAGVVGYVTRDDRVEDLVAVVRAAAAGELVCSPHVAALLLRRVRTLASAAAPPALPLTDRELEIGRLLERGLSNKQIASELHIELTTVKNHVHRILEKLGASRRGEAAAAIRRSEASA